MTSIRTGREVFQLTAGFSSASSSSSSSSSSSLLSSLAAFTAAFATGLAGCRYNIQFLKIRDRTLIFAIQTSSTSTSHVTFGTLSIHLHKTPSSARTFINDGYLLVIRVLFRAIFFRAALSFLRSLRCLCSLHGLKHPNKKFQNTRM